MTHFKLVRDFIKSNILTKFHHNLTENVTSRAYTRFFKDLPQRPSFIPDKTQFQDKHSHQVSGLSDLKCGLYIVHEVFLRFDLLT